MINDYIRKDLANFRPYEPEKDEYEIKLDANENPYKHSEIVIDELREAINNRNLTRYPDTNSTELVNVIADYYKVKYENVVCGVGLDQIIDTIAKVFIEPSDKVLIPTPSFSMFKHSVVLNHGVAVEYKLDDNYEYNVDEIIDLYNKTSPKFIIICSPNNPTGNILPIEEIERLARAVKCPVIVDEAYSEFSKDTAIDLISKYEHVVVLRTFSKIFGLAGLRLGYAIGSIDMINAIKLAIPPYNINTITQEAGTILFRHIDDYKIQADLINESKVKLANTLADIDLIEKVYPSYANFFLVKSTIDDLSSKLKRYNILTRDFSKHPLLINCLRITVGNSEENQRLVEALHSISKEG